MFVNLHAMGLINPSHHDILRHAKALHHQHGTDPNRDSTIGVTPLSIEALDLSGNELVTIRPLSHFPSLRSLNLSSTGLSSLPCSSLPRLLTSLHASSCHIAKLTSVASLACLIELDLSYNSLTDLSGFHGCSSLRSLTLSRNQIRDIEGIQGLRSLQSLVMDHNNITSPSDIRSLSLNISLSNLDVSHNPVSATSQYRFTILNLVPSLTCLDGLQLPRRPTRTSHRQNVDNDVPRSRSVGPTSPDKDQSHGRDDIRDRKRNHGSRRTVMGNEADRGRSLSTASSERNKRATSLTVHPSPVSAKNPSSFSREADRSDVVGVTQMANNNLSLAERLLMPSHVVRPAIASESRVPSTDPILSEDMLAATRAKDDVIAFLKGRDRKNDRDNDTNSNDSRNTSSNNIDAKSHTNMDTNLLQSLYSEVSRLQELVKSVTAKHHEEISSAARRHNVISDRLLAVEARERALLEDMAIKSSHISEGEKIILEREDAMFRMSEKLSKESDDSRLWLTSKAKLEEELHNLRGLVQVKDRDCEEMSKEVLKSQSEARKWKAEVDKLQASVDKLTIAATAETKENDCVCSAWAASVFRSAMSESQTLLATLIQHLAFLNHALGKDSIVGFDKSDIYREGDEIADSLRRRLNNIDQFLCFPAPSSALAITSPSKFSLFSSPPLHVYNMLPAAWWQDQSRHWLTLKSQVLDCVGEWGRRKRYQSFSISPSSRLDTSDVVNQGVSAPLPSAIVNKFASIREWCSMLCRRWSAASESARLLLRDDQVTQLVTLVDDCLHMVNQLCSEKVNDELKKQLAECERDQMLRELKWLNDWVATYEERSMS